LKEGSIELSMVMMLDSIAERYGLLPSQVIDSASTFDLFVLDTAIGYRNMLQERAMDSNKKPGDYTNEELLKILEGEK
jgi:hypothetical protein